MGVSLLEFPCRFPVKAMTRAERGATAAVLEAVRRHAGEVADDVVTVRSSRNGHYLSVTVVIEAVSREQLDAIYRDITAMDAVVMAL